MRKFLTLALLALAASITTYSAASDVQIDTVLDPFAKPYIKFAPPADGAATNFLFMRNADTAGNPLIQAIGSDANVSLDLKPSGTGVVRMLDANGVVVFQTTAAVTSAVNQITLAGSATGLNPSIAATGTDTNIGVTLKGKGTGNVTLGQSTTVGVLLAADQPILDSAGNELIKFVKTTTAVDELTITNAATAGHAVDVSVTGGDSNVSMTLTPKGTGAITAQLGGSTSYGGVLCLANAQYSAAGIACTAGSTDDTLFTYTMPANTLKNVGDFVVIEAYGTGVATNAECKIFFGGTAFVTTGVVSSASPVIQKITVIKTGSSTQLVFVNDNYHGTTANIARPVPTTAAITDTANIIIKSTANSGAATTLGNGFIVWVGHGGL